MTFKWEIVAFSCSILSSLSFYSVGTLRLSVIKENQRDLEIELVEGKLEIVSWTNIR